MKTEGGTTLKTRNTNQAEHCVLLIGLYRPKQTSLVFSWMSMTLSSQLLRWDLMKPSILGNRQSRMKLELTRASRAPLMYLWVRPWTAAMLHFPKMSNIDCGYPGTRPFDSFIRMYLFSSGSMETIVGHPRMWDLKKLPYLPLGKSKQTNLVQI